MAIDTRAGSDPPPTVIKKANCVGTEESISQCPQDNNHVCLNLGAGVHNQSRVIITYFSTTSMIMFDIPSSMCHRMH